MGKGKDKKKKKNKEVGGKPTSQEKALSKAAKKSANKLKKTNPEDDLEAVLAKYSQEQAAKYKVTEESISGHPSPRVNASLIASLVSNELLLFGGEYYNGSVATFYNDFYRFNIDKREWRKISSPHSPPPRSSHQMIATPTGKLFLFGGEFASIKETSFFHYRDCWMCDLKTCAWEKLEMKTGPSARSGHRMAFWKNWVVLFGGFYDNYIETKYFDDLWLFDLNEYKWQKLDLSPHDKDARPSARSGFLFLPSESGIALVGGFSKKGEKSVVHTDAWFLKMSLDKAAIRWERRKKSGFSPSIRSGMSGAVYKNKAVVFGGVYDEEGKDDDGEEDDLVSVCYNDLYLYNVEGHKWYPLNIRQQRKRKSDKSLFDEKHVDSDDDKYDILKTLLIHGVGSDDDDELEDVLISLKGNEDDSKQEVKYRTTTTPPHPRFNANMAVHKNLLFIFGGVMEAKEREYTLDDFWMINLDKMTEFICLKEPEMNQEWIDSEKEDDLSDDSDEEGNEIEENELEEEEETECEEGKEDESDERNSKDVMNVESTFEFPLDPTNLPAFEESLKDYFERTSDHWTKFAFNGQMSANHGKALRRDAFSFAQEYYHQSQPYIREETTIKQADIQAAKIDSSIAITRKYR